MTGQRGKNTAPHWPVQRNRTMQRSLDILLICCFIIKEDFCTRVQKRFFIYHMLKCNYNIIFQEHPQRYSLFFLFLCLSCDTCFAVDKSLQQSHTIIPEVPEGRAKQVKANPLKMLVLFCGVILGKLHELLLSVGGEKLIAVCLGS